MSAARPRFHFARRLTQVGLLLFWCALPWLDVVRIEVDPPRVVLLGSSYPIQFPYILGLIIPFVVTIWLLALLSYLKGRVFCGWACPYGSAIELFEGLRTAVWRGTNRTVAAWMRRSPIHKGALRGGAILTLILAPVALAFCLAAYLVPPRQLVRAVFLTPWGAGGAVQLAVLVWVGLMLVIAWVAGFFVRFHFCRMVCIYGMGQAMAADAADPKRILRPRFLPETLEACGSCQACLKACFVELDPREPQLILGFSEGCFNCGDCIDVCTTVQGHKGGASLLSFRGLVPNPPRTALGAPSGVPQGRRDEHSGSMRFERDAVEGRPPPQPGGTTPGGRSAASAPLAYEPNGPAGPSLQSIPPDDVAAHGGFGTSPRSGGDP